VTSVPAWVNVKCKVHTLETGLPSTCAGLNFQFCAACKAIFEKYLLGPAESNEALSTLPDGSTETRTVTSTWPRIV